MAPYLSGESFTESNLNSATDGIIAKSMPAMQNSKEYDVGKGIPRTRLLKPLRKQMRRMFLNDFGLFFRLLTDTY